MKTFSSILICALAALALPASSFAQPLCPSGLQEVTQFRYSGAPQEFTVPDGLPGEFYIEARGADGACVDRGGSGATMSATVPVTAGSTLLAIVGESGGMAEEGITTICTGGGGSGLFIDGTLTLLAAAGSGGSRVESPRVGNSVQPEERGVGSVPPPLLLGGDCPVTGRASSAGGGAGYDSGSAGGGLTSNGEDSATSLGIVDFTARGGRACVQGGVPTGGIGGFIISATEQNLPAARVGDTGGYGCGGGGASIFQSIDNIGRLTPQDSGGGGGGYGGASIRFDGSNPNPVHEPATSFSAPEITADCIEGDDTGSTESNGYVLVCAASGLMIEKEFSTTTVDRGEPFSATITLSQTSPSGLTGIGFTDQLPEGMNLISTDTIQTTCEGALDTTGSTDNQVVVNGLTAPSGSFTEPGECSVTFSLQANVEGSYTNTILGSSVINSENIVAESDASATISVTIPDFPEPEEQGCSDFQDLQFQIDGAARELAFLQRKAVKMRNRAVRRGLCSSDLRLNVSQQTEQANDAFLELWELVWTLPRFTFDSCSEAYSNCSQVSLETQLSEIESLLKQQQRQIKRTLRVPCLAANQGKRVRALNKRASRLRQEILSPNVDYPREIVLCTPEE